MITIYCDGACRGNGTSNSRGGWAYIIQRGDTTHRAAGGEKSTTNQRMELMAAIMALKEATCNYPLESVELYTDSAYLCNCYLQNWWKGWEKNGWVNSKKEPVANQELWKELIQFFNLQYVQIFKVKGHNNIPRNEEVDKMACAAADKIK